MTRIAILLKVMLLAPQPLGPEAQPYQARRNVGFQSNQPVSKISEPPLLLMNLIPSAPLSGIRNLPLARAIRHCRLSCLSAIVFRTDATLPSSDTRTALNSRADLSAIVFRTDATLPSSDTRTALNSRADIPYRCR